MVVEVMGRNAGWIALHSGVAGGASVILLPEIDWNWDSVVRKIKQRVEVFTLLFVNSTTDFFLRLTSFTTALLSSLRVSSSRDQELRYYYFSKMRNLNQNNRQLLALPSVAAPRSDLEELAPRYRFITLSKFTLFNLGIDQQEDC